MRVRERTMFYGASSSTFDKARLLRNNMTEAEKIVFTQRGAQVEHRPTLQTGSENLNILFIFSDM